MLRWCLLPFVLFATENFHWERTDKPPIEGFLDVPEKGTYPLLFLVQGEQRESVLRMHEFLKEPLLKLGIGLISIERRGPSLDERLEDALYIVAKGGGERWNQKWILLGQSDGGKVAARIAKDLKGLEALALVSPGGAWKGEEEMLYSFRMEMSQDLLPLHIHSFLVQARAQIEEMKKQPELEKQIFGLSSKYLTSLFKMRLLEDLASLSCPIYYVHGKRHDRIPLESVEALQKQMGENATFRLEDRDASLVRDQTTYLEMINWLTGSLLPRESS